MYEKIKEVLKLKKNGRYIYKAKEVAKFHGVSLNAVYNSRKKGNRLDKLMVFDKLSDIIKEEEKKTIAITGDKKGILDGLSSLLKEDKKYKILYKEI